MKSIALICMLCMIFINSFAETPPIIDREIFFGDPDISGAQISPDGKFITFLRPFMNVRNIWIKERSQKFDQARPLTADTLRPVSAYFWSQDSRFVLYVQDKGGDENYRIYEVDPHAKDKPVPTSKDLTPLDNVRAMVYDVPRNTPDQIIIGLNDRDPKVHDVYHLELSTGKRTLIRKNMENIADWVLDLKGNVRLGVRQTSDGGTEILKVDGEKLNPLYSVSSEESAYPIRFTPDGNSFYFETNKGKETDLSQLALFNVKNYIIKPLEKDPLNQVDFGHALFSDVTNELLATVYNGDTLRLYPKQKKFAKDYAAAQKILPRGEVHIISTTSDEQIWLLAVSGDVDPGTVYLFDRKTGSAEILYKYRPDLPTDQLAKMKPVHYKARDGLDIPAYLTLPKGVPARNLPVVMFIHGGPWVRDEWGYDPVVQFLANRGYAVLQPNFRGSTGYGKKFLNAGNKQWGTGTMQHDITDGVNYIVKQGIGDSQKVAIAGGSYGGYATLSGLAFTPGLFAAGFDIVGPSNLITLLNSIPPYWEPMKKTFSIRVGDIDSPEGRKTLEQQSPLFSAKNIKAPLFVVQGANDPRVKKAESDQIVVALRDLGRNVQYMVAPDEGHGYRGLENRIAMYTAMEKFFSIYMGGLYQQNVRPEIQNKLDSIMVDIKTVSLSKQTDTGK